MRDSVSVKVCIRVVIMFLSTNTTFLNVNAIVYLTLSDIKNGPITSLNKYYQSLQKKKR